MFSVTQVQELLDNHLDAWDKLREEMTRYRAAYENKFWDNQFSLRAQDEAQINIQVALGHEFIESYIASLFSKHPAVVLKPGLQGKGNVEYSEAVVNDFLMRAQETIERCSRLALIYPHAYMKLIPVEDKVLYRRMVPIAIEPWNVLVDEDAQSQDLQRYIGHWYTMTTEEAKDKFGKKMEGEGKIDYFKHNLPDLEDKSVFEYVQILEFYDLVNDQLLFYSPQYKAGEKFVEKVSPIPFRDFEDRPITPLIPFYFSRLPDQPLMGYGVMQRIYDQCYEMNIIRSYQASAVRKASRQYIVKKGAIDEESMAKVTSGIDGLFVEVETDDMDSIIRPVPHVALPHELQLYAQQIMDDRERGGVTASFTRGESTRATATEIAALAAYTSSELGRMARARDGAIEGLAKTFLPMMAMFIDQNAPEAVLINDKAVLLKAGDLMGDFVTYASDMATTPMSEQMAKQQLLENVPTLLGLGVAPQVLLQEIVRMLNLPESFLQGGQAQDVPRGMKGFEQPANYVESLVDPSPQNVAPLLPLKG
tara:strand:- start:1477 stop:3081 length:1605 start_codon:yes stop_codon:yes gene_type:complete